ncbi:MAG: hypothetical protein ABL962_17245 [Fimbriimonadaceae bacterium]
MNFSLEKIPELNVVVATLIGTSLIILTGLSLFGCQRNRILAAIPATRRIPILGTALLILYFGSGVLDPWMFIVFPLIIVAGVTIMAALVPVHLLVLGLCPLAYFIIRDMGQQPPIDAKKSLIFAIGSMEALFLSCIVLYMTFTLIGNIHPRL